MWHFIIFSWVVYALDWSSTIAGNSSCMVEENPVMRAVWCDHGVLGFTLTSLAFALITHLAIRYGWGAGSRWAVGITVLLVVGFKFAIALTNLNLIPLWVTGWWVY